MEVRIINRDEFYPIYVQWSEHYEFAARPIEEIDTVVACYKGDVLLYTCFFWHTLTTYCIIGYPFANPYATKEEKEGGLELLFKGIARLAQESNHSMIFTTSNTPPVEKALLNAGYVVGDRNVNQYFGVLSPK